MWAPRHFFSPSPPRRARPPAKEAFFASTIEESDTAEGGCATRASDVAPPYPFLLSISPGLAAPLRRPGLGAGTLGAFHGGHRCRGESRTRSGSALRADAQRLWHTAAAGAHQHLRAAGDRGLPQHQRAAPIRSPM